MILPFGIHKQAASRVASLLHRLTSGKYSTGTLLRDVESLAELIRPHAPKPKSAEATARPYTTCAVCGGPLLAGEERIKLENGDTSCVPCSEWLRIHLTPAIAHK